MGGEAEKERERRGKGKRGKGRRGGERRRQEDWEEGERGK